MTRGLSRLFLAAALLLAAAGGTYSQRPEADPVTSEGSGQKAVSYSFVSPNTRENLKLDEAIRMLNSREEDRLVSSITRLSRCLRLSPAVSRSVGSWADGAEHSTLFRVYADKATVRYEDARLGKLERQKAVLYFRQRGAGEGFMYILYPRGKKRSLASVAKILDASGVQFRTLVPAARGRTIVYVVDLKGELREQVSAAAQTLGARVVSVNGDGEFIGDDADRDKAQEVFSGVIKEFEDGQPRIKRRCTK
jgi:hypothetical protein